MKNTTITFRLAEQEKEQIMAIAAKKDIPSSQMIREAVRKYIQEEAASNGKD